MVLHLKVWVEFMCTFIPLNMEDCRQLEKIWYLYSILASSPSIYLCDYIALLYSSSLNFKYQHRQNLIGKRYPASNPITSSPNDTLFFSLHPPTNHALNPDLIAFSSHHPRRSPAGREPSIHPLARNSPTHQQPQQQQSEPAQYSTRLATRLGA